VTSVPRERFSGQPKDTDVSLVRRIVFGPWPFFAVPVFLVLFFWWFFQAVSVSIIVPNPVCRFGCVTMPDVIYPEVAEQFGGSIPGQVDIVLALLSAAVPAAIIVIAFIVGRRVLRLGAVSVPSLPGYIAVMLSSALAATAVRLFALNPVVQEPFGLEGLIANTIRTYIAVTIVQAASGLLTDRYRQVARKAEDNARRVTEQQALIVEADERARREVAEFLHDRVQADLLVCALELRRASESVTSATRTDLEAIVRRLELIRSQDVRGTGRRLSPDIEAVGLDTALIDLASSWSSAMAVEVDMKDVRDVTGQSAVSDGEQGRAVYRVVEQALLNAAAHGHATAVRILLIRDAEEVTIEVVDNGVGLSDHGVTRGKGFAIIDAWTMILGGTWTVASRKDGGAVLSMRFPVDGGHRHPQ
jgi:signal transduction histidine kinase